ncbi:hypothetical protein ELS19_17285 [Halogeometricum borinquense]|uniref:Uncharacterized protein n=1 Tax=Halogeometricum borinquense TaxID=60847 RepID=A0A482SXQ9_9EURY|nr:hypothetical protein [Halogeometricum borinquense]RYJ08308.1 hypothetical protein ELS19_17285 [Halogeometricum borinquense]
MSTTGFSFGFMELAQTNFNISPFVHRKLVLMAMLVFVAYWGYKQIVSFSKSNGIVLNPRQSLWYLTEQKRTRRTTAFWGYLNNIYRVLGQRINLPFQISELTTWLSIIPLSIVIIVLAWTIPSTLTGLGGTPQIERSTAFGILQIEATISSLTFIVVIFILQYVEGQPHDERGMQTFVQKVYMLPIIFTTLLLLAGTGWIYISTQPDADQNGVLLSPKNSLAIILGAALVWTLIVLIYVLVSRAILSETIDENIKEEIIIAVSKNIETEGRRRIAEGLLSVQSPDGFQKDEEKNQVSFDLSQNDGSFGDINYELFTEILQSKISNSGEKVSFSIDLNKSVGKNNPRLLTSKSSEYEIDFQDNDNPSPITLVGKNQYQIWEPSNEVIQRLDKYIDLCTKAANEGNPSELKSRINDVRDVAKTICNKCIEEEQIVSRILEEELEIAPNATVEGGEMSRKVRCGLVELYSDALNNESNEVHLIKQTGGIVIHSYQKGHYTTFEQYFKALVAYHNTPVSKEPHQSPTEEAAEIKRVGSEVLLGDEKQSQSGQLNIVYIFTQVLGGHAESVIHTQNKRFAELWEIISELRNFTSFWDEYDELLATTKVRDDDEISTRDLGIDFQSVANQVHSDDPQMSAYVLLTELRFHMIVLTVRREMSDYPDVGQTNNQTSLISNHIFPKLDDFYNFGHYFERFVFGSSDTLISECGDEVEFGHWSSPNQSSQSASVKDIVTEVLVSSLLFQVNSTGINNINIGDDPFGNLTEAQQRTVEEAVDDVLQSQFWKSIFPDSETICSSGEKIKGLLDTRDSDKESRDQFGERFNE